MRSVRAKAAIAYAREVEQAGGQVAAIAILEALAETLRYAESIEQRLNQHFVGGSADHPDLRERP